MSYYTAAEAGRRDADRLGIEWRGLHSFRRSLITQTQAAGVPEVWIARVTHGRASDVISRYTGRDIDSLRAVTAALSVKPRPPAEVVALHPPAGPDSVPVSAPT